MKEKKLADLEPNKKYFFNWKEEKKPGFISIFIGYDFENNILIVQEPKHGIKKRIFNALDVIENIEDVRDA